MGEALCRGSGGVGASAETSNNGAGSGGGSSGAAAIDEPRIDEPGWKRIGSGLRIRVSKEGREREGHGVGIAQRESARGIGAPLSEG